MKIKKPYFFDDINFFSLILYPVSLITFLINNLKKLYSKRKFKIKIICVGNIYIGGTGKTPMVLKINSLLKKRFNTVLVKKKYTNQVDEQNILKKYGNLICLNHRENALRIAERKKYDLAILDDGLQDKSIYYNISIACFNSSETIGNGFLLPAGPLRESINELMNYDAIFLNGEKRNNKFSKKIKRINKKIKIFNAKYFPINLKSFNLKKNYLFFCGLGSPNEFERTLKKYKFKIKEKYIFPDHYDFANNEIKNLKKIAKEKKLEIITTEKDYLRLNNSSKVDIKYLKIELKIQNKQKFLNFLNERL